MPTDEKCEDMLKLINGNITSIAVTRTILDDHIKSCGTTNKIVITLLFVVLAALVAIWLKQ